ncbi:MAG: hypothetical protein HDT40_10370 [Lachnospiraceae bacterium]|nr:hypothetical protein [Lachnospiraceae bacterium]
MNKLKKSAVAKLIACILMSVSILFAAASTVLLLAMFDAYRGKMVDTEAMKAEMREAEIERIANQMATDVVYNYYRALVEGDEHMIDLYRERYSEDNSNFAFVVEPVEPNEFDLPVLSNYEVQGYQYHNSFEIGFETYPDTIRFTFHVGYSNTGRYLRTEPLVIQYSVDGAEAYDYNPDVTEAPVYDEPWGVEATTQEAVSYETMQIETHDLTKEYCEDSEKYYAYFRGIKSDVRNEFWTNTEDGNQVVVHIIDAGVNERGNYVVSNGIHAYLDDNGQWNYLDMDVNFCNEYNAFFQQAEERYSTWNADEWYDSTTNTYIVELSGTAVCALNVTSYVKNSFTAHDDFYYSIILRYGDTVLDYIYVIFGVSTILTLLFGTFLVVAAGYGKKSDEPYASEFNRVPYDIILVAIAAVALGILAINPYWDSINIILIAVWLALTVPFILLITCSRIKTKTLVSSTVCGKIIMFLWREVVKRLFRWIKKAWKNICKIIKILWDSIGLYGKYLGVFAAVAVLEAIVCMSSDTEFVFAILFIEKLTFGAILVIACINLSKLKKAGNEIAKGNMDFEVDTKGMLGEFKAHGENLNSIRNGMANAVEESLKSERMKTELITNVSHDIKTPLTSIINYVDLLEKEKLDNEKAGEYIEVLDRQSARLKKLIQDLIDASKASTGNLDVTLEKTDVNVVINQALGEFQDKLAARDIKTIIKSDKEEYFVIADGRHLWRVMENLINNIVKYALEGSRVYIDVKEQDEYISVTFKNISKEELNISGDELMERFVRGDSSRNTEGSGLGLSIARSLMELQKGKMEIIVDGDLFKVVLLLIVG